jgi:small subunit ribosomal protein S17
MTNEEVATEVTDESHAVTASAPDRSTGDTTGELQRASGEAASGTTASAPDRSTGDTPGELQRAGGEAARSRRKVREGVVVSAGMDKTAVVAVVERVRHPKYNKTVLQTKKLHVHDEADEANVGDRVRVMETRPLSKLKRWRITDVLERAK